MSTTEIAMNLGNYETLFPGEMERLIDQESDYPRATLEQIKAVSTELEGIYGPNLSPDFPFSNPSPPRKCDIPTPMLEYPDLLQTQINEVDTDTRLADIHQTPDPFAQSSYCYPDPSQIVNQTPVNPYFIDAAPHSGAQYQQLQEPLSSVNFYPQYDASFNQINPSEFILEPSQDPLQGPPQLTELGLDTQTPFKQINPSEFVLEPSQDPFQGPPQLNELGLNTQTPYNKSQIDPLPQHQSSVKPQDLSQPQFIRPGFYIGTPFDTSEFRSLSPSSREIVCNNYPPLENAPACWDYFEYNQHGELKPGNIYSVEEIEWYLFRNPKHLTPFGYFPKLGGLTLWIQRAPNPEKHCHSDPSVLRCRLKCCEQAGIISEGELRVAFDEQTRMFPNHNPQHNAGYVHFSCLERFLDFPRTCIELIVKAEDRVLSAKRPTGNCMMLQSIEEVDLVDRFVNFCSANRRAPASYPVMNMQTHTRPFQGTLISEINIVGHGPYLDHMQQVWETQGRSGVMAECERKIEVRLKKRRKRAMAALQVDEPGIQAQYTITNEPRRAQLPKKPAAKKASKKGKKRARELEPESESEPEFDSAQGFERRGRKRARISKFNPNAEPVQRNKRKKELQTRKAEVESQSKSTPSKQGIEEGAGDNESPPSSKLAR
ncbi:hypothetical protein MMC29_000801 [Sticta canariensis]|nr:hypothetical protein [Sticta canariensis]